MGSNGIERRMLLNQNAVCVKYNVEFSPTDFNDIVGIALESLDIENIPINGLRHPIEKGTSGWYIWSGELSPAVNFFKPSHVNHLLETCPEILDYLGLPPGWRFLIDNKGYEEVWFDKSLLLI